ncbi:class I SAM-dependent methyltransferase [Croceitalea rosinachiae]|uniref:Class I SAM-dependent methyltransferase n=1 Tax=Croceitalea rosinachiae TaxID=3075596 RepID=A0ABU3AE36_9FLAO|nr:class I SAM-dependent methyltransferase [Croceitalea sp. F388]MDT0608454.1 class I SAM-dependent methyltransferase [Croceitalea sp. F388]
MNKAILKTGFQEFIKNNWNTDIVSVLLKKPFFDDVTQKELSEQLEAKKKCKDKLPTWFATPQIYYPKKLHIEQTSSEQTAKYKASIIKGKSLLDITGGLGVDSYFFSKEFDRIIHCEINQNLSEIAAYNFDILNVKNIKCIVENGLDFLSTSEKKFDWVFIDPSRRNDAKGKVFLLQDCLPNVPANLKTIFEKTENVMIKTAPLLDISQGISDLKSVKEVHVVAFKNEVKELLWILKKDFEDTIQIKTTNLQINSEEAFDFTLSGEKKLISEIGLPEKYLYEPNAAILKSGGFKSIGEAFGLKKLHEHSHLYTSNQPIDFPGRRFKVENVFPYTKKEFRKLKGTKANITTRNFPESVATIRKKLKISDGGDSYLFFTTDLNDQLIFVFCQKI